MDQTVQQNPAEKTAPFAATAHVREKHFVTAGEKKFDALTYTKIGYVANALLSVVAVAAVERTGRGQRMMENFQGWAERNVTFVKPKTAKMLATKSFFLTGGFLVLAPMKFLEDAKTRLVKQWNREAYGEMAETDPKIVQSQKELEAAPKQSWSSIFSSRVLALVPFYAGYALLWDHKSTLAKGTDGKIFIDKPIVAASRWLGKVTGQMFGHGDAVKAIETLEKSHPGEMLSVLPEKKLGRPPAHDPVHSVVPYYFISEAITSAMVAWGVYVLTRVTGPFFDKKKDNTMKPVPWQPSSSAIPITERREGTNEPVSGRDLLPHTSVSNIEYAPERVSNQPLGIQHGSA